MLRCPWPVLLVMTAIAACSRPAPSANAPTAPPAAPAPRVLHAPVQVEMRHVRLEVADGVALDIDRLRGEMASHSADPLVFDDAHSYTLRIATAVTSMDMTSLSNLMNTVVFAYDGAPLSGISVKTTKDGRVEQTATLHKGVPLHVSMKASVSATSDGRLRLHVESVHVLGVPSKGLMDLLGLTMEDVVNLKNRRGLEIQDNDIVIAIGQVMPPPQIEGRLTRVTVEGDRLVQTFDVPAGQPPPASLSRPDPRARNYLYFFGSDIRFGKLTMTGTDLQLIDADPKDPFDFYPAKYLAQLVAGYSKTTPSGGVTAYVPDYGDVIAGLVLPLRPGRR